MTSRTTSIALVAALWIGIVIGSQWKAAQIYGGMFDGVSELAAEIHR